MSSSPIEERLRGEALEEALRASRRPRRSELPRPHRRLKGPRRLARRRAVAAETYGRIPPWRRYSRSRGVSRRTRARNSLPSARTVTSSALPLSTPSTANSSRPVRPSVVGRLALEELQRQDPHHQQVRAMDPLVRLGDHRPHAEEVGALGGPVARRAGAVLLAGDDDERRSFREVSLDAS